MTSTNINFNWQELIHSSGGLADTVSEIDGLLAKFGTHEPEKKIKIMINNIAVYFKKNNILETEITSDAIDECYVEINKKLSAKEIKTAGEFIIAILVELLSKLSSDETNYLTTKNSLGPIDEKVRSLASSFKAKNPGAQLKLVNELEQLSKQGNKKLKEETIAFSKNLSRISNLRYV